MNIVDYSREEMGEEVFGLFKSIYPEWTVADLNRVCYDEAHPLHAATKVAIEDAEIVGQANVFRLTSSPVIANLGYHVHPDYRRRGIGTRLAVAVMEEARKCGITGFVIQTEACNTAATGLAKKLGFTPPAEEFLKENETGLKYQRLENGVCLCLLDML